MEEESLTMLDDDQATAVIISYLKNSPPGGRTTEEIDKVLFAVDAALIQGFLLDEFFGVSTKGYQVDIVFMIKEGE